jgi:hypothetical protein
LFVCLFIRGALISKMMAPVQKQSNLRREC